LKKIPEELKKGVPSEKQRQNQNLQKSLKTPWINGGF
jgi:hypothetical protein